jgi:hypothetical protein
MWDDETLMLPYKATGFTPIGERLMAIFTTIGSDPLEDTRLVDEWAFELGLKGWYQWVPHKFNE